MEERSVSRQELKPPLFSDAVLVIVTVLMVLFSIMMIYSITGVKAEDTFGDRFFYVKRQLAGAVIGGILMVYFAQQPLSKIRRFAKALYILSIVMLVMILIPQIGDTAGGARRWINLGIIKVQPAEMVKVFYVIFLADFFARRQATIKHWVTSVVIPGCYIAPLAGLLLMQPDFGSTSILAMVTAVMIFTTTVTPWRWICAVALSCISFGAIMVVISPYRLARVTSMLNPLADPRGKGYQLIQSLITVSGGSFNGVGLGESQQTLGFLPAAHTDFLFAVVAEELGFVGAVFVMLMFLIIFIRGVKIAERLASDTFAFSLAVGLTSLIVLSAMANFGVVVGLLPTKGMVLPLLAYGGSSLMTSLATVGILLALARESRRHY